MMLITKYYGVKGRLRFAATETVPRGGHIKWVPSQSPQTPLIIISQNSIYLLNIISELYIYI